MHECFGSPLPEPVADAGRLSVADVIDVLTPHCTFRLNPHWLRLRLRLPCGDCFAGFCQNRLRLCPLKMSGMNY